MLDVGADKMTVMAGRSHGGVVERDYARCAPAERDTLREPAGTRPAHGRLVAFHFLGTKSP